MHYALIRDNVVDNVTVCDSDFAEILRGEYQAVLEIPEGTVVNIGWAYANGAVVIPEAEPAPEPAPKTVFTKLEFQLRFTFAELVAIETAAATDPGVRVLQSQQAIAEYIDIKDPNTQLGVMYLVSNGYLTHARGLEILDLEE